MGLRLNVDLDTNRGQTNEAYILLESVRFNRVNTRVEFTTSLWLNKESALAFQKKYIDSPLGSSEGMLQREVIYYKDSKDTKGTEITLDNYFMADIARDEEIITPVYDKKEVIKKVPFITFDEEGEEVVKEKEITKLEKVQVGENKEIKKVFDISLVHNIFEFTYSELRKQLSEHFPIEKLEIV